MTKKFIKRISKYLLLLTISSVSIVAISVPISRIDIPDHLNIHPNTSPIAIIHVNVIPFEGIGRPENELTLFDQTILIKEGKIVSMSSTDNDIPIGYEVIDAKGKYIMPGLSDMHTHLFDRSDLNLYLACGVTTVRNMMGFPMHLKWKRKIANGEMIGPSIFTGSPTLNSGDNTGPFHKKLKNGKHAAKAVNKYSKAGYDFIKIYDGIDSTLLDVIMNEAKKNNLPVVGHIPYNIAFEEVLRKDIVSLEHVEEILQAVLNYKYNEKKMRLIAGQIKESGIYITPTLSAYHHILQATELKGDFLQQNDLEYINPVLRFIGKKQLKEWIELEDNSNVKLKFEIMQNILRVLHEEEIPLLLGTDTGPNLTIPGLTLIEEINLSIQSGLSVYNVLESGTINAAKALKIDDISGSVSIGKSADLILLEDNPLQNISTLEHPFAVFKNGSMYDQNQLKELREKGKKHTSSFVTIGRLIDQAFFK